MHQPPGFVNPNAPTHVCQLRKFLYGLKQALRARYNSLLTISYRLDLYVAKETILCLFSVKMKMLHICYSLLTI